MKKVYNFFLSFFSHLRKRGKNEVYSIFIYFLHTLELKNSFFDEKKKML